MKRALTLVLATFTTTQGDPLACTPNNRFPMVPIFHFIGNVTAHSP